MNKELEVGIYFTDEEGTEHLLGTTKATWEGPLICSFGAHEEKEE